MSLSGTSVNEKFVVNAKTVINCGGLYADKIAEMVGLKVDRLGYRLHHCKGDYFRLLGKPPVKMLVYPVPKGAGLGIHLTPDLGGSIRLGPNAYYVNNIDYEVESSEKEFREDVKDFCQAFVNTKFKPIRQGLDRNFKGRTMGLGISS